MHFYENTDPDKAWCEGWGQFLRLRSLITIGVFKGIAAVISFFKALLPVAIALTIVLLAVYISLFIVRHARIKVARINERFHYVAHWLRDNCAAVVNNMGADEAAYNQIYTNFSNELAENIASFFRETINESSVYCSIRLATRNTEGKGVYATKGRSNGMDPRRARNSTSIPCDKGVAHVLRENNQQGVVIIKNIQDEIATKTWYKTPNDELSDIQTMMVAPINMCSGPDKKFMLGILYISSKKDIFNRFHVDLVRAFADILGLTYPIITRKVVPGRGR